MLKELQRLEDKKEEGAWLANGRVEYSALIPSKKPGSQKGEKGGRRRGG